MADGDGDVKGLAKVVANLSRDVANLKGDVSALTKEVARLTEQMPSKLDANEAGELMNKRVMTQIKTNKKKVAQVIMPTGFLRKLWAAEFKKATKGVAS
jgi:uncharacterized protein YoxC